MRSSPEGASLTTPPAPPLEAARSPEHVQPGGGLLFEIERAWGRVRRALLRALRPGYVRRMAGRRAGACEGCTHDVIDARDLKLVRNVCGIRFHPDDDRFRWRDRLRFARYGLAELVLATIACAVAVLAAAVLSGVLGSAWPVVAVSVPAAIVWGHAIWFFRDPTRTPPADERALLSPADGVVTHIDEVDALDFPGGRAARISIYLSIWDVHLNRNPRRARVLSVRYFRGEFLNARHRECVKRNEQLWVDYEEPCGRRIRVKQISGALARRLVCFLRVGEEVAPGERFGMIKFGSRTDVLVPTGEARELAVAVGERVQAGTTVLLRFGAAP